MTTPADERARLRALAEKATPGAWSTSPSPTGSMYALPVPRLIGFSKADAHYIAALSPAVVLRLLDDVERLTVERDDAIAMRESEHTAGQEMLTAESARAVTAERRAERMLPLLRRALPLVRADFPGLARDIEVVIAALAEPAPGGQDAERAADKGAQCK